MAWLDDSLPIPVARPIEGEEALEAAGHALAALAAGIAATQLLTALVFGEALSVAFFAATLLGTAASAFVGEHNPRRRAAFLAGGSASVLVWLTVLPQAPGPSMVVVLAMAGTSAAVTRQLLSGEPDARDLAPRGPMASSEPQGAGWIEDDVEGMVAA